MLSPGRGARSGRCRVRGTGAARPDDHQVEASSGRWPQVAALSARAVCQHGRRPEDWPADGCSGDRRRCDPGGRRCSQGWGEQSRRGRKVRGAGGGARPTARPYACHSGRAPAWRSVGIIVGGTRAASLGKAMTRRERQRTVSTAGSAPRVSAARSGRAIGARDWDHRAAAQRPPLSPPPGAPQRRDGARAPGPRDWPRHCRGRPAPRPARSGRRPRPSGAADGRPPDRR